MSRAQSMQPKELQAIIEEVYGTRGQRKLAADIERTEVTICRWARGAMPIGSIEAAMIRLILVLHRKGIHWQKWMREHQKKTTIEDML